MIKALLLSLTLLIAGCASFLPVVAEPEYVDEEGLTGRFFPMTIIACKEEWVMEELYKVKINDGVDQFMLEGGNLLKSGDCTLARAGTALIKQINTKPFTTQDGMDCHLITLMGPEVMGYYSVVVKRKEVEESYYKESGDDTGDYFEDGQIV